MIKFLASDFDGTLYRNNKISTEDLDALKKLKKKNNKVILATGRSLKELKIILASYSFPYDYLVLCNGAMILDKNNKEISKNIISNETRKAIINKFYNIGNALIYYDTGHGIKIIENKSVDTSHMEGNFLNENGEIITLEEALTDDSDCEIMSIFSTNNSIENSERIKELLLENHSNDIEAFRNSFFVDIVSKGCSKGNALINVLEMENSTVDHIYCIGDSMNDITMFNITPNSYTFNYTEEVVKKHATHLVDNVFEVVEDMLNN